MHVLALVFDQCSRAAQPHELTCACADVYLGAPCAVPLDPRQRLVVPKYNPARTFTPEVGTVEVLLMATEAATACVAAIVHYHN